MKDTLSIFIPITKVDEAKRLVYGTITEEIPDASGEILDYATAKVEFQKWSEETEERSGGKSKGNVRAMHSSIAAGKLTDIAYDDDAKKIEGVAKVVDDDEWQKVLEGVYTGFSMGGRYKKRWADGNNPSLMRYTPQPTEVSLVDNPCVPTATFSVIKQDGSIEMRKFTTAEEGQKAASELPTNKVTPDVEQVWKAKDGSTHLTKRDAVKHNEELDNKEKVDPVLKAVDALEKAVADKEGEPVADEPKADAPAEPAVTDDAAAQDPAPAADPVAPAEGASEKLNKVQGAKLKKGMYEVSRLAEALGTLDWLQQCIANEAAWEGDGSDAPAKLKANIANLCQFLREYVAEETAELSGVADSDETAAKKDETKKDDEGGEADASKSADSDLQKSQGDELAKFKSENEVLKATLTTVTEKMTDLAKRLENIEKQPAPAKAIVRAVAKGQEISSTGDKLTTEEISKQLSALPAEERAHILTKLALSNPKQF